MAEDSDAALVEAWRGGDREAGKRLFSRHYAAIARFFRNKVGEAGPDLIQRTFLACLEGRERFRGQSSFRTYLFATARNLLFQHLKKQRRGQDAIDFESSSLLDLGPSPSSIAAHKAEHRLLLEALRRIPVDYQIALELYHWEGLTGPQLAEVPSISEAALRSRLHRAKLELRRQMEAIAGSNEVLESTWFRAARGL